MVKGKLAKKMLNGVLYNSLVMLPDFQYVHF
jgi:hypothetical protein